MGCLSSKDDKIGVNKELLNILSEYTDKPLELTQLDLRDCINIYI